VFDWTDLIAPVFSTAANIFRATSDFGSANDRADLADRRAAADAAASDRQSQLDIETAARRAAFDRESASLQAGFLRMQGDAFAETGEFNAGIFDTEADIALKLAARDKEIIKDNAAIQRSLDLRRYHQFQSEQVAAVAGAGITLSGSAADVMLDSASFMDYMLAIKEWQRDVAVQGRDVEGNLQSWEAHVNATRERFTGQLNRALKFKEAEVTEQIGELAAAAEEQ
jgi:hypothetical protein